MNNQSKWMTAEEAVQLIPSESTLATGGFVGIGFPESLAIALEQRYLKTGFPKHIQLVYAAGQGDGKMKGLNHFGHEGLLKRVIGGHWGLVPEMGALALANKIEAYNFPQGVISHLFRDIAAGKPGTLTHVGLHTFVDPRVEGGKMNEVTRENLVDVVEIRGKEYLLYHAFPIHTAFLRGTAADEEGNISMEREALSLEALAIAQAVKNSGGKVIVQVLERRPYLDIHPQMVQIPSILTDAIVLASPANHMQTFAEQENQTFTQRRSSGDPQLNMMEPSERKVICSRAALFLKKGAVVNLGIGMPEGVAQIAFEWNMWKDITLTVEPGGIGGIPAGGLSFGAVSFPSAIISQPSQFDFYDGGGLDQAFLGMAEVDALGNVNVSKFGKRIAGAGGFINISQNAKEVYFLGTFTTGAKFSIREKQLIIEQEGIHKKWVKNVSQITYSGKWGGERNQVVWYITERAVFKLTLKGLLLVEIAPGIDLQRDVLDQMDFLPLISDDLKVMSSQCFI